MKLLSISPPVNHLNTCKQTNWLRPTRSHMTKNLFTRWPTTATSTDWFYNDLCLWFSGRTLTSADEDRRGQTSLWVNVKKWDRRRSCFVFLGWHGPLKTRVVVATASPWQRLSIIYRKIPIYVYIYKMYLYTNSWRRQSVIFPACNRKHLTAVVQSGPSACL